jgi:hypothetical protein
VFAVWITIGFFDYNNGQIGAEIGRSEGRNVRHRLFAVVDRSNTLAFSTTVTPTPPATAINPVQPQQGPQAGSNAFGLQPVQLTTTGPVAGDPNAATVVTNSATGMNWAISAQGAAGSAAQFLVQPLVLVYDPGAVDPTTGASLEETVVATPVQVTGGYQLQAAFTKSHALGATVLCFGHPGAPLRYDPRQDTGLVIQPQGPTSTLPNGLVLPGVVLHYSIID